MERHPAWSPDGKSICYLSDAGGEYKLVVRPATGEGEGKSYELGNHPAYYYRLVWSPDSSKIAYTDNHHVIWYLDLASGKNTKIDELPYENPTYTPGETWSPDSKWITYQRELDNHLNGVFL
jgi:tricorn protease